MADASRRARSPAARISSLVGALLAVMVASVATLVAIIAIGRRRIAHISNISNPLAGGMATYYAFRAAGAIVPRLPARLVYGGASLVGTLFWLMAPRLRERARRNLRHIPRLAADPQALERAVRGVFGYVILNYLDFLRAGRLSTAEVMAMCHVESEETFRALATEGRGLVVLVPHSSAFELAGTWLAVMGYQVVIPVERMRPEPLFEFFRKSRERLGVRFLPADRRETLHEMMRVLRSGGVLVFAVDRLVSGASVELPLFGVPLKVPITPATLALRMGARVGAAFPYRLAPAQVEVLFVPLPTGQDLVEDAPTDNVAPTGKGEGKGKGKGKSEGKTEAGERLQRRFMAELERFLTAHPEQWVGALAPVWEA